MSDGIIDKSTEKLNPLNALDSIIGRFKSSDDERLRAEALKMEPLLSQLRANEIEAGHSSGFVAGARPSVIWVCSVTLALYFWPRAVLGAVLWAMLVWQKQQMLPYPEIGIAEVVGILTPLLGLGGYRTIEKIKGVATKRIGK